jgi:SAM-dependent methyltransferase
MQHLENWRPTKVVRGRNGFRPSSDPRFLSVSSRLVAGCQFKRLEGLIRQYASGDLLDLGCGHVPYFEVYKDLVKNVVCVDWENSPHKNVLLDYSMDLNCPLSFADESFDTILLIDVLEHIYKPAQLLSEVRRILRRGGHCVIVVPFFYWLHERPFDFHRYTEFALRRMCEGAGLEVKDLTPYGGAPEILMDIVGKCMASSKLRAATRAYTSACRAIQKLGALQAVSQRTAALFPMGYVLAAQRPLP